ncbi:MAG: OmpA family protein [Candidatus Omnitrophota bacterium]
MKTGISLMICIMMVFFALNTRVTMAAGDENSSLAVKFLVEYGKFLFDTNDLERAADEFNKALLIEPGNIVAKDYLRKINSPSSPALTAQPAILPAQTGRRIAPKKPVEFTVQTKRKFAPTQPLPLPPKSAEADTALLNQINNLKQDIILLQDKLVKAKKDLDQKDKDTETFKMESLKRRNMALEDMNKKDELIAVKDASIINLKQQLELMANNLTAKGTGIQSLNSTLQQKQQELNEANNQYQEKIKAVGDSFMTKVENLSNESQGWQNKYNLAVQEKNEITKKIKENIQAFKSAYESQIEDLKLKNKTILDLISANEAEQKKVISALDEAKKLNKSITEKDAQEISRINDLLQKTQEELTLKETRVKELEYSLTDSRKESTDTASRSKEAEKTLSTKEKELQALNTQLAAAKDKLSNLIESNKAQEKRSNALLLEKDRELSSINSQLNIQKHEYSSQVNDYANNIQKLKDELTLLGDSRNKLNDENKLLKMDSSTLKALVNQLEQNKKNQENESNKKLSRFQAESDQILNQSGKQNNQVIADLKTSHLKELEKLMSEKDQEIIGLTAELKKAGSQKDAEAKDLTAKHEASLNKLKSEKDQEIAALNKQIQAQSMQQVKELEKLKNKNDLTISKLIEQHSKEVISRQSDVTELRNNIEVLQKKSDKDILNLKDKNRSIAEELQQKENKLKDSRNTLLSAESLNKSLTEALEGIKNKQNETQNTTEKKLSSTQDRLNDTEKTIIKSNLEIERLNTEIKSAKNNADRKIEEKDRVIASIRQESEGHVNAIKKLNTEYTAKLSELNKELTEKNSKLTEYETQLNRWRTDLTKKEGIVQELQQANQDLISRQDETALEAAKWITDLENAKEKIEKTLNQEIKDYKMKLELSNKGIVVTVLSDILFDSGSAKIKPESSNIFDRIADVLKDEAKDSQIIIEGYTDNEPIKHSGWKSNWELSSARAISVLNYFVKNNGLSPSRLSINAYGEFKPVGSNSSAQGRQKNRRVEIIISPVPIIKVRGN